jgi:hypothetical protein
MAQKSKVSNSIKTGVAIAATALTLGHGVSDIDAAPRPIHNFARNGQAERREGGYRPVYRNQGWQGGSYYGGGNYYSGYGNWGGGLGCYTYYPRYNYLPYYSQPVVVYQQLPAITVVQQPSVIVQQSPPVVVQQQAQQPQAAGPQYTYTSPPQSPQQSAQAQPAQVENAPVAAWTVTQKNFNTNTPIYAPACGIPESEAKCFDSYNDFLTWKKQIIENDHAVKGMHDFLRQSQNQGTPDNRYYEVPIPKDWVKDAVLLGIGGLVVYGLTRRKPSKGTSEKKDPESGAVDTTAH